MAGGLADVLLAVLLAMKILIPTPVRNTYCSRNILYFRNGAGSSMVDIMAAFQSPAAASPFPPFPRRGLLYMPRPPRLARSPSATPPRDAGSAQGL